MAPPLAHYAGSVLVSVAYLAVYYGLLVRVAVIRARLARQYAAKGERFDRYYGRNRLMLAADRAALNTLEQMPPFLALLWLHTLFVNPGSAVVAGAVYIAARAAYPLLLGQRLGGTVNNRVMFATAPAYLVLLYFAGSLVWAVLQSPL